MRIQESGLGLASEHRFRQELEIKQRLEITVGAGERFSRPNGKVSTNGTPSTQAHISDAGRTQESDEAKAIDQAQDAVLNDPMLRLLRVVIEWLTGEAVEVFDASSLAAEPETAPMLADLVPAQRNAVGIGIAYDFDARLRESERTQVKIEGRVRTADGREITLRLELEMRREFEMHLSERLRLGTAQRKDPLIVNFSGTSAQLSDQTFSIDLDGDGTADRAHFAAAGSGFLVFDRNGDGIVNDGSELVGARSGDGFADLGQLDDDGNGWVDEGDRAYTVLRIWTRDAAGKDRLQGLNDAGVGAISVSAIASPFALRDSENIARGDVRSTGLYLTEDGKAGSIQQIDLLV